MTKHFDEKAWEEAIHHPDWYLRLHNDYERLKKLRTESSESVSEEIKEDVYGFFEHHLARGDVALGDDGQNWDAERKPIDTVVIHHSKNPPGITWQRLSVIHLVRLYAGYYRTPTDKDDFSIQGRPIFSHHFRNGQQIFYSYHWLIRMDGSAERLLLDNETGWQAGNWEINCKSVGICLDNNFENTTPPELVLTALANLIKKQYPNIHHDNILGHCEVNRKKSCPGKGFLGGWKDILLEKLSHE